MKNSTTNLIYILVLIVLFDSCQSGPDAALLEQAKALYKTNVETRAHLEAIPGNALVNIMESGSNASDIKVADSLKSISSKFDAVIQPIDDFQKQYLEDNQTDTLSYNWTELIVAIDKLLLTDVNVKCQDSLQMHLSKFKESQTAPDWRFIHLTNLEKSLLDRQACLMEILAIKVGSNDLRFDSFYDFTSFGIQVDSLEMDFKNESYTEIFENPFQSVNASPLSTFSIDVDIASYANVRRFIDFGVLPPKDAVRLEEMINYFSYDYPNATSNDPISISTQFGSCSWNENHNLLMIGLKAKDLIIDQRFEELPASNLVFLIDVSGSMSAPNKLPLVKKSLKKLTAKLRDKDRVSIVVYASASGVVLEPTPGSQKQIILTAINSLEAGGSTAGGAGINLAYELAQKHFDPLGNNRVVLATDGDFNVGVSSDEEMLNLIKGYRKSGIYITCLGFGMGNYKDSKLETIADNGNGNYAYIDSEQEAAYVLESGFAATLYTVAKDVKLKVEFNPNLVQSYRLLGYENRIMPVEDYDIDEVDAGDMGSGQTVTAIYELIMVGSSSKYLPSPQNLNYFKSKKGRNELATISFRYKRPKNNKSEEIMHKVSSTNQDHVDINFMKAAAVTEFGLLLRASKYQGNANYASVQKRINHIEQSEKSEKWAEFQLLVSKAVNLER